MYGYERSYKTGRSVCTWLEFFGWLIVVLGVVVAIIGFSTGGVIGGAIRGFANRDNHIAIRVIAAVPGILVVAGGLVSIMLAQHTRATLDTTEMTRDILNLMKRNGSDVHGARTEEKSVGTAYVDGATIKNYKGFEIRKGSEGVTVSGSVFKNVIEAEKFIDGMK